MEKKKGKGKEEKNSEAERAKMITENGTGSQPHRTSVPVVRNEIEKNQKR